MKKILVVITIAILLGSAAGITSTSALQTTTRQDSITCSNPIVITTAGSASITIPEATTYSHDPGLPALPVITKTYVYQLGTTFESISCTPLDISTIPLQEMPAVAQPIIPLIETTNTVLSSRIPVVNPYPSTWSSIHIGIGLQGTRHVVYVTIQFYPVRYLPATRQLAYSTGADVTITSHSTAPSPSTLESYKLVIIAPRLFAKHIQPLIDYKISKGITTKLVTTEQIYKDYTGTDKAEQVKKCIQDAVEHWNTSYVLLFGGMKGQRYNAWYVPIRYSNLDDASDFEASYLSDLYYEDIYKYDNTTGYAFDTWDSNSNGIFAEWNNHSQDILDMYPDVYVGRIPCRYPWDVAPTVNRIMTYEKTTAGQPWFKKMTVLGGDSFDDVTWNTSTDYLEGQEENAAALSYMTDFTQTRIWVQGGDINYTTGNAVASLSEGEGFVYFSGHGNPQVWSTHPHNDFNTWIDFSLDSIDSLTNGYKLPVVVVGGCHNCQFNCSLFKIFDMRALMWGEVTSKSWGWQIMTAPNGGSIATIGNTGLGYGTIGDGPVPPDEIPDSTPDGIPDCTQYLDGWLEPQFFHVYHDENISILGQTHGTALTNYLNTFPIDWSMQWSEHRLHATLADCKSVQEWVLFGDPSLQIGGYA
jgi:hypothetical protein